MSAHSDRERIRGTATIVFERYWDTSPLTRVMLCILAGLYRLSVLRLFALLVAFVHIM